MSPWASACSSDNCTDPQVPLESPYRLRIYETSRKSLRLCTFYYADWNVARNRQKRSKMVRAGLYARVSTYDQKTLPMQYRAMREYASRRGWTIALQVREVNSEAARREAREKLIEAARFAGLDP